MRYPNEPIPNDEEEFFVEEIDQDLEPDLEPDESLINWRLIGTIFLSTILIISFILGMIGPALIQMDVRITVPTATPTPNPLIRIGFGF